MSGGGGDRGTIIKIKIPISGANAIHGVGAQVKRSREEVLLERFKAVPELTEQELALIKQYADLDQFLQERQESAVDQQAKSESNKVAGHQYQEQQQQVYKSKKASGEHDGRKLFVTNFGHTREDLEKVFERFTVDNIYIPEGKQYGFVTLRNAADVDLAIRTLSNRVVANQGLPLVVQHALKRPGS